MSEGQLLPTPPHGGRPRVGQLRPLGAQAQPSALTPEPSCWPAARPDPGRITSPPAQAAARARLPRAPQSLVTAPFAGLRRAWSQGIYTRLWAWEALGPRPNGPLCHLPQG